MYNNYLPIYLKIKEMAGVRSSDTRVGQHYAGVQAERYEKTVEYLGALIKEVEEIRQLNCGQIGMAHNLVFIISP